MRSIIFFTLIATLPITTHAKMPELSPGNFSAASLTVAFDRTIKLTEKNRFRFPIRIDSYNRCYLSSLTPLLKKKIVISKGSQWRSQPSSEWNDWDSKNFSFKLTHRNVSVLLKCELNLAGEIFLYHSSLSKKASLDCVKHGGRVRVASPKAITHQKAARVTARLPAAAKNSGYCVKHVSKLNTSKFKLAFLKKKIHVNMELPTSDNEESFDTNTF